MDVCLEFGDREGSFVVSWGDVGERVQSCFELPQQTLRACQIELHFILNNTTAWYQRRAATNPRF